MYIRTNTAFPRVNPQWQSILKIPYGTQNGGLIAIGKENWKPEVRVSGKLCYYGLSKTSHWWIFLFCRPSVSQLISSMVFDHLRYTLSQLKAWLDSTRNLSPDDSLTHRTDLIWLWIRSCDIKCVVKWYQLLFYTLRATACSPVYTTSSAQLRSAQLSSALIEYLIKLSSNPYLIRSVQQA